MDKVVKSEPIMVGEEERDVEGDEEVDYDEMLRAERLEFVRKAKLLGYNGSLTPETAISRLVEAAQSGELQNVPDPVTAGIFEQMERKVGARSNTLKPPVFVSITNRGC
jgi:hypothetical protein